MIVRIEAHFWRVVFVWEDGKASYGWVERLAMSFVIHHGCILLCVLRPNFLVVVFWGATPVTEICLSLFSVPSKAVTV